METQVQTVHEVKCDVDTMIHILYGMPEIKPRIYERTEECHEFVCLDIGTATIYFDEGVEQFKAFVGEMIKAVANLK